MSHDRACSEVHQVLALLGRAWAGAVLWSLLGGAERYGEIRAGVPGVSDAVLSARLKELCEYGLVERLVEPGPPTAVRYRPTAVGQDARAVLESIRDYAQRHPGVFAR
ncbi:MAG: winged helix-turn-helix transcriptional regulator [Nocardioides sp.]|uniref:winged helix-turn-helix transcriptional regulator n=1 Tax=Nocardioides sp. TaxID=35761 RepID=UPI003F07CFC7